MFLEYARKVEAVGRRVVQAAEAVFHFALAQIASAHCDLKMATPVVT